MKTDAKTMAEVLRKIADNLENGINSISGIQFKNVMGAWIDKGSLDIDESVEYRIKPKTITLKNGVVIPKYIDKVEVYSHIKYYYPSNNGDLFSSGGGNHIILHEIKFPYKTQDEAIEASKKLFGIE